MTRASWDTTWMRMATAAGQRSRCVRAQIGAVIVTADNRMASVGYSGPPANRIDVAIAGPESLCSEWCPRAQPGADLSLGYESCATIHAEVNALLRSSWDDRQGGTLYVNGASCQNCAKVVAGSGITRVVHQVWDTDAHRNPEAVEKYLQTCGINVDRYKEEE